MFYTETTEQTCKTRRFCGIYGLYVNNSAQKTYFFGFGYWRPWVRVPPLRPKRPFLTVFFSFCRSRCGREPTRFDNQAKRVCKLACKRMSADCSSVCSSLTSTVRSTKRNACTEWSIPAASTKKTVFGGLFFILLNCFRTI